MIEFSQAKNKTYVVIVEPDGEQMPNIYYRRLKKWGLMVRGNGDKEVGPLLRRYTDDGRGGVIAQECCFVVTSESLAKQIAALALEHGANNVLMSEANFTDNITMTREDLQIMERINEVHGRRGRPPKPESWVVVCNECMAIQNQETFRVVQCYNCGGFRGVHSRHGVKTLFQDPIGDVFTAWARTRFANTHWEPVEISPVGKMPPPLELRGTSRELAAFDAISASPVLDVIRGMKRQNAFDFLDAILISRAYRTQEERDSNRLTTVASYLSRGADYSKISIIEEEPDLIDAALNLDLDIVVDWLVSESKKGAL